MTPVALNLFKKFQRSKLWEIVLIGGKVGKVVIFDIIGGDGGGGDNEDEIFSNSIDSCDDEEVDIEIGLVRRREFLEEIPVVWCRDINYITPKNSLLLTKPISISTSSSSQESIELENISSSLSPPPPSPPIISNMTTLPTLPPISTISHNLLPRILPSPSPSSSSPSSSSIIQQQQQQQQQPTPTTPYLNTYPPFLSSPNSHSSPSLYLAFSKFN
ncbi:21585_t:CDS:2 [Entrophospora sp. SA101]|nr:21585_t:CDS:2 [Entrophospora sp. SA101]